MCNDSIVKINVHIEQLIIVIEFILNFVKPIIFDKQIHTITNSLNILYYYYFFILL